jgi:hypothetical protein
VDLRDTANYPWTLSDLLLRLASGAVVEIQVIPAIALRHPDNFLSAVHFVPEGPPIVEESFGFLGDDCARAARRAVNLNDPVDLMAALVVFECQGATVRPPGHARECIRVRKEVVGNAELPGGFDMEDNRLVQIDGVTRFRIELRKVFWLDLIRG